MQQVKILLVQLASNGDCLFVTAIAKQIKEIDYPGCHLTWLIGSRYKQVIDNNPYIDCILQLPINNIEDVHKQRNAIGELILSENYHKKFHKVFVTDFFGENYKNLYGTTRSSLFRNYPHTLKISPKPLIYLTDDEKKNVAEFCCKNNITNSTFNILFECLPQSGQSKMTFSKAKYIAERICVQNPRVKFILTSSQSFISDKLNIIDGSVVSWRENAELANYCHLLVGCSSGISWLCTSSWTKAIQCIQIVDPQYFMGKVSASMKTDFKFFGINRDNLIELNDPADDIIQKCILAATNNRFKQAKRKYDVGIYRAFFNFKFLGESSIPYYEKIWVFFCYFLTGAFFFNVYNRCKPTWFTPVYWINKYIKIGVDRKL